jgi:hypothetical protein
MAIEITEFAQVSISVSPTGESDGNFGILGFLTNEADVISTVERTRSYTSLASVGSDWATTSEVYKAATAFYSQTPTPTDFTVLVNFTTAQDAKLVGGGSSTPAELIIDVAGAAGDLVITTDAATVTLTALDLSGVTATYAAMAIAIQALLQAEVGGTNMTCIHNGYQFVIGTGATGASSTISTAAVSDAALALGLTQATAKTQDGFIAGETAVTALTAAVDKGTDFVGLVSSKVYRDSAFADDTGNSAVDIANWCEANKKIFCNTSNDLTTLATGNTNVASKLKDLTLRFSLTSFAKDIAKYPSAGVFGRAASVNFNAVGSTITMNLKQVAGVVAEDLSPTEFKALRSYNASAVVQIGGSSNAYTDSRMASGSWLDTTHGLMWLENRMEVDMFNLLYVQNTKIPYTQTGINTAVATVERSCEAAVRNGLCAPGYLPDGTYLPKGYIVESISLADVSASDKSNRVYSGISFKMVGAGALHEVEVSGDFSE